MPSTRIFSRSSLMMRSLYCSNSSMSHCALMNLPLRYFARGSVRYSAVDAGRAATA